jgi:hypothetical protein
MHSNDSKISARSCMTHLSFLGEKVFFVFEDRRVRKFILRNKSCFMIVCNSPEMDFSVLRENLARRGQCEPMGRNFPHSRETLLPAYKKYWLIFAQFKIIFKWTIESKQICKRSSTFDDFLQHFFFIFGHTGFVYCGDDATPKSFRLLQNHLNALIHSKMSYIKEKETQYVR